MNEQNRQTYDKLGRSFSLPDDKRLGERFFKYVVGSKPGLNVKKLSLIVADDAAK
jgi:hypothetical protein